METAAKPETVWCEYDQSGLLIRLTDTLAEMARVELPEDEE